MDNFIDIGNIGKHPPVISYTKTGKAMAKFSMAFRKEGKDAEGNYKPDSWVTCTAFGWAAEGIEKAALQSGDLVQVQGKLEVNKNGDKVFVDVVVTKFRIISRKSDKVQEGVVTIASADSDDPFADD